MDILSWSEWLLLMPSLIILLGVIVIDPFGGWRYYWVVVAGLLVTAVGGALLIDVRAGGQSLVLVGLWTISRVCLLFAAVSVVSGLYAVRPLTLNARNSTVLVAIGFALAAAGVDPLLALIAVLNPMLRVKAPIQSVVVATVATLLGSAVWAGKGPFAAFIAATLLPPKRFEVLWHQEAIWLAVAITVPLMLGSYYAWHRLTIVQSKRPIKVRAVARSDNLPGWYWVGGLFTALVVVQFTLPDVHDRLAEAVIDKLAGKEWRIQEDWYELMPWREVAYLILGGAAYVLCRSAQKDNNFSFIPIGQAARVMALLFLAAAPLMAAIFLHQREWPSLVRLAYELLNQLRTEMPDLWLMRLVALGIATGLLLFPSFPVLALLAHDRHRIQGAAVTVAKWSGVRKRLTPLRHIVWAAAFAVGSLWVASMAAYFVFG